MAWVFGLMLVVGLLWITVTQGGDAATASMMAISASPAPAEISAMPAYCPADAFVVKLHTNA